MPHPLIDLTGRRFGRLVVHHRAPPEPGKKPVWVCICDCGNTKMIVGGSLTRGFSTSCGCVQRAAMSARRTTHGRRRLDGNSFGNDHRSNDLTYSSWSAMKLRCRDHPKYAGRGIRVCPRWLGPGGFANFVKDMGERPARGMSINRIDNAGHYCAATCGGLCGHAVSNCNWATHQEQMLGRDHIRKFTAAEVQDIVESSRVGWTQERLARHYGVGRRVIRRIIRDATAIDTSATTSSAVAHKAKRSVTDAEVAALVASYRCSGFPWGAVNPEADSISRVRFAAVTVNADTVVSVGSSGQRGCLVAHLHRLEARRARRPSVVEAFNDDDVLTRTIRYQLERGDSVEPWPILRALQAFVRAPRNFPPALARWLVDEYAPSNGTVLDPCAGFGGRLLGTVASTKNLRYVGFDIEPRTVEGNRALAMQLSVDDRTDIELRDAIGPAPWPSVDLVITSPPYFNLEDYGTASQSKHETYEAWHAEFLRPLMSYALRAAPRVIINIARVGPHDLPVDVVAIVRQLGGTVERVITWPLRAFGRQRQYTEKILVIRSA